MKKLLTQCSWMAIVAILLSGSLALAQRRVLTNEDISSAPAASDAAPASSDTASPPASSGEPGARPAADMPSTPVANLSHVRAIQETIQNLVDAVAAMTDDTSDPMIKKRWMDINLLLGQVYRANQLTIEEMQAKLPVQPPPAAAEEPAPAPVPEEQAPPQEQDQPAPSQQ